MLRLASHRAARRVLAVMFLVTAKLAVRFAPARTLRALSPSFSPASDGRHPDPIHLDTFRRLGSTIDGASRLMAGTCLDTAVASCLAARLFRVPVRLRIGVDHIPPDLRAHAWVECEGVVLVGGTPVPAFDR